MLLTLEITRLDFTSLLLLGDNFGIVFSIISTMVRVKIRLFCTCRIFLVILVTDGIVAAYGREEAEMLQIFYLHQCLLVESNAQIGKETIEEIEHIEADTRLRTFGIQYPVRIKVFVRPAAVFNADYITFGLSIII